jgi:uncharacterized protein (DUF885 family)
MPARPLFRVLLAGAGALIVSTAQATPSSDVTRLCAEYWEGHLEAHPTAATSIGDRRYDDKLEDNSPAGIEKDRKRLEGVLRRARAIPEAALGPAERLNRAALIEEVEGQIAALSCGFHEWSVDPLNGPQVEFMNLQDYTRIESVKDATNYTSRCRAMARYVDQHVANLKSGLAKGRVASRPPVEKTIRQLDALLAQPTATWAVLKPGEAEYAKWKPDERATFKRTLTAVVEDGLKPALTRYRDVLQSEILPAARPAEKAGVGTLPQGLDCYRKLIRVHTSVDRDPEALHRLGLEQVERFRRGLAEVGKRALGTDDVTEIQKKLRSDAAMHFAEADQVESKAREALARAKAAMPKWFGIVPKADCEVKVMGMHEAPYSTIAYYRNPAKDGSRPGYYMINTYKPETRPRYEAEALAFHEAIPGHHLQIAVAQELTGLPEFRKFQGVTSYVEGWALYTERLADEMGLYSTDLDRIGMWSYDAWRACRLVVDTGLHAMGWSRQQAIDYMLENSVLAENNIENEVDRYITWPGQALAYKVGQLEILALRDEARRRLGDQFDIRAFHDVVLRDGAVTLPVLRRQVEAFITSAAAARP